eukprot:11123963-Ditylum_brightwellii.AAC.2
MEPQDEKNKTLTSGRINYENQGALGHNIKFLWDKFFELQNQRNEKFKDRLTTLDQQYIFQSLQEIEEFLQTRSVAYIKGWIAIWYPFDKQGIKNSQKKAIIKCDATQKSNDKGNRT